MTTKGRLNGERASQIPTALNDHEDAALSYSAITALPFFRDVAKLKPVQSLLIGGAGKGVDRLALHHPFLLL